MVSSLSLQLGGEAWNLRVPDRSLLSPKWDIYARAPQAGVQSMQVDHDGSLLSEVSFEPRVWLHEGAVRFEGQQARWQAATDLKQVSARAACANGVERALLGWACSSLVTRSAVVLHAALIGSDRGAYLLLGGPGAGKTTACMLSHRSLCTNVCIARPDGSRWLVYTTPITGQQDPFPVQVGPFPLAGAFVVEKAPQPEPPVPVSGALDRMRLIARSVCAQFPPTRSNAEAVLGAVQSMAGACPVSLVRFTRERILLPEHL